MEEIHDNPEDLEEEPPVVIFGEDREVIGEYFWVLPNDITGQVLALSEEEQEEYLDGMCRVVEEALKTISTLALNRTFFLKNTENILKSFEKIRLETGNAPDLKPPPKRYLN